TPPPVYSTLSLHDALPIWSASRLLLAAGVAADLVHLALDAVERLVDAAEVGALVAQVGLDGAQAALVLADARGGPAGERQGARRSEEHTSELQSLAYLVCR